MAERTGYKIIVYLDDNPLSPTYMETYEERVLDETTCPIPTDDLVLISNECEADISGYTGYRLETYYNTTTGEYSEVRVEDPECIESSTEEQWVASGDPYCETTEKGVNTGYMLQLQVQMNPNLENYGETRNQRYKSPDCGSNTCAIWDDIQKQCHVAVINCNATFDGTSDISQIDINPLSETYNQTRTINRQDSDCENCTETTFSWVSVGDMCGDDELLCTNGIQQVSTNSYTVSQKYKTIGNGTPIPMDEYQVTLKTEDDEDCGYIRPQYRWDIVTGQYICDYETYTKYEMKVKMVSYDAGETWATKQPIETERGEVIALDSYDCGKPMYKWVETEEFVCIDNGDDYKVARVNESGDVISSITCSDSILTTADTKTIRTTGGTYIVGQCVNKIGRNAFSNSTDKEETVISIGDYVETIETQGLQGVGLGYYDSENKPHPLVMPRNLKYLGDGAFGDSYNIPVTRLLQFTTEEPPVYTGNTSGTYQAIRSFDKIIVPFGSLTKYKNCSWLSGFTTTNIIQEPWTASTDNYKFAIECSGVTFYLADDYTEELTEFDTLSLLSAIDYYFETIYGRYNQVDFTNLKAWVGTNVKTLNSNSFPNTCDFYGLINNEVWFNEIHIQSSEPPTVYDDTFRRMTWNGQSTKIIIPCEYFPTYYEDEGWDIYKAFITPADDSCITNYEWIGQGGICELSTGKIKEYSRKYVEINGATYPTLEYQWMQTDRDCVSVTLDGGWKKADCSELCKNISVSGYSCTGAYYGHYETTALINVSGIRHFTFYVAQNADTGPGGGCSGTYGTVQVYNVDNTQMTGNTYFTTQSWTEKLVTFELDGEDHVIPIRYTNNTAGSWAYAVGSLYLRDEYKTGVASVTDNLPSGWSKSDNTYTASYDADEDLIFTIQNCSSISFKLVSQYKGKYSNYFELYDLDINTVVETTPRKVNENNNLYSVTYTFDNIPFGTHTIRVKNVIGAATSYPNTKRTITITNFS